ncbi:hypothetical protein BRADI_1g36782v3, partial [Brachypodium distachyon]
QRTSTSPRRIRLPPHTAPPLRPPPWPRASISPRHICRPPLTTPPLCPSQPSTLCPLLSRGWPATDPPGASQRPRRSSEQRGDKGGRRGRRIDVQLVWTNQAGAPYPPIFLIRGGRRSHGAFSSPPPPAQLSSSRPPTPVKSSPPRGIKSCTKIIFRSIPAELWSLKSLISLDFYNSYICRDNTKRTQQLKSLVFLSDILLTALILLASPPVKSPPPHAPVSNPPPPLPAPVSSPPPRVKLHAYRNPQLT